MKARERTTALRFASVGLGTSLLCFLLLHTCKRFEPEGFLYVNTGSVSEITSNSASSGGEVTDDGGDAVTVRGVCWGTSPNPTVDGSKTEDGTGTGTFTSSVTGLAPETTYYLRAYATSNAGTAYGEEKSFTTTEAGPETGTVVDYDGNVYQTLQIGSQEWMAENLKTTRYADGSAIPLVEGDTEWANLTVADKAYCWYDNSTVNRGIYGGLYNWAAAMKGAAGSDANPSGVQGVCPDGWHLPSDAEWKELEMFLGMSQADADDSLSRGTDEGGKLKEAGTTHWDSPNTGATNESGFSALPGGVRGHGGSFYGEGGLASFWTGTEYNASRAWRRGLVCDSADVRRGGYLRGYGFSIRCVKGDASVSTPTVTTSTISNATSNSATGGGEVTSDGGAEVTARGICWSTSSTPTISNDTTMNGTGTGIFTSTMTGLSPNNKYYVRAYATNSAGTAYGDEISFNTSPAAGTPVTDIDGNEYQTIYIGEQLWMAENLKTTRYADGTGIPQVEGGTEWEALDLSDKAFSWYDNSTANRDIYGGLYTWAAAMNGAAGSDANPSGIQGVCPDGWQLPSDADWKQMEIYLGMLPADADKEGSRGTSEGGHLKDTTTVYWNEPNEGATNRSGFTALPGGYRTYSGSFSYLGNYASFWTATEADVSLATGRYLGYDYAQVFRDGYHKNYGFSVRCIEGEASPEIPTLSTSAVTGVSQYEAVGGGEVTADGGAEVTARGICWSTFSVPSIADDTTLNGKGIGSFIDTLKGLTPNTMYYVRAFAINSVGVAYGNEESFTTLAVPEPPSVSTNAATSVEEYAATMNGEVTSDGGAAVSERGFYFGTSTDPASTGTLVPEGSGTGSFSNTLSGLDASTTYYYVAYATNTEGTAFGSEMSFTTLKPDITGQTGTLSDVNGNSYNWIGIGKQAWMAENLWTTRFADGTEIPNVQTNTEWDALSATDTAYCWYNNTTENRDTYGGLYTWTAAMYGAANSDANPSGVQGVCPDGWHLPSDEEWKEMEMFLGMTREEADKTQWRGTDEGGKLKESGTDHWSDPNTGATNESGFTALPGGHRYTDGLYGNISFGARYWTTSQLDGVSAYARFLYHQYSNVQRNGYDKDHGFSVRCVRDD